MQMQFKIRNFWKGIMMLVYTYSINSWAVPSASTTSCGAIDMVNDTNSAILRDTDRCDVFWVMPPQAATTKMKGIIPNSNSNFCLNMKYAQNASLDILKRSNELTVESTSKESDIEKAKDNYNK